MKFLNKYRTNNTVRKAKLVLLKWVSYFESKVIRLVLLSLKRLKMLEIEPMVKNEVEQSNISNLGEVVIDKRHFNISYIKEKQVSKGATLYIFFKLLKRYRVEEPKVLYVLKARIEEINKSKLNRYCLTLSTLDKDELNNADVIKDIIINHVKIELCGNEE